MARKTILSIVAMVAGLLVVGMTDLNGLVRSASAQMQSNEPTTILFCITLPNGQSKTISIPLQAALALEKRGIGFSRPCQSIIR
jgi:hypothetical protein